jgi:predicted DNA-binding transcriptional regulator AlpA
MTVPDPTKPTPPDPAALLLDVKAVACLLTCSTRHVYRLADSGLMPQPVKVGALVRWPRPVIEQWIASGCPAVLVSAPGKEG